MYVIIIIIIIIYFHTNTAEMTNVRDIQEIQFREGATRLKLPFLVTNKAPFEQRLLNEEASKILKEFTWDRCMSLYSCSSTENGEWNTFQ